MKSKRPLPCSGSDPEAQAGSSAHGQDCDLSRFAHAVEYYRDLTSCSVISWGRSHTRNLRWTGEARSKHLVGLAVDVVYDRPVTLHTAQHFAQLAGLTIRRERDHDHLEPLTPGGP
jgi:hypothetical protein